MSLIGGAAEAQRGPSFSRPIWHLLCQNLIPVALRDKFGRSRNTSCAPGFVFGISIPRHLLPRSKYCCYTFARLKRTVLQISSHAILRKIKDCLFCFFQGIYEYVCQLFSIFSRIPTFRLRKFTQKDKVWFFVCAADTQYSHV